MARSSIQTKEEAVDAACMQAIGVVNAADTTYLRLGLNIRLIVTACDTWTEKQQIDIPAGRGGVEKDGVPTGDVDSNLVSLKLGIWHHDNNVDSKGDNPRRADMSFMLTRLDLFSGGGAGAIGNCFFRGMCTLYQSVGVIEDTISMLAAVRTFTHELGHAFGAEHDGDVGCDADKFVMAAGVQIKEGPIQEQWSTC